ncbi:MAG: TasA family protein [Dehalococcoidia bacterium]|nr:TasA family protein [Dehalococcoidia bacterium]
MRKKLLLSLFTIAIVGSLMGLGAFAQFTDQETSSVSFTAGTIDIAVNGENPWTGTFTIADAKPCQVWYSSFVVTNVGTNPCVVWKTLDNFVTGGGDQRYMTASSEPEYQVDPEDTINDIDNWINYDLSVKVYKDEASTNPVWHQVLYNENEVIGNLEDVPVILGSIPVGGRMEVTESYHLRVDTPNKYQGDTLTFDIVLKASQLEGTMLVLENKDPAAGYLVQFGDVMSGTLTYNTVGSKFEGVLNAQGLLASTPYDLIYYADPWPGKHSALIGTFTADGSGYITDAAVSVDLGIDLPAPADANAPIGAKIWLVPAADYDEVTEKSMIAWNPSLYLWETYLIWYNDTDV